MQPCGSRDCSADILQMSAVSVVIIEIYIFLQMMFKCEMTSFHVKDAWSHEHQRCLSVFVC